MLLLLPVFDYLNSLLLLLISTIYSYTSPLYSTQTLLKPSFPEEYFILYICT